MNEAKTLSVHCKIHGNVDAACPKCMTDGYSPLLEAGLKLDLEVNRLRAELEDIENATKGAMDETCGTEQHCACVPLLRVKIKKLEASNAELLAACEWFLSWLTNPNVCDEAELALRCVNAMKNAGYTGYNKIELLEACLAQFSIRDLADASKEIAHATTKEDQPCQTMTK